MAIATLEKPSVESGMDPGIQLVYKDLLTRHRDEMVAHLVDVHGIPTLQATAMIDQLWVRLTLSIVKDRGIDLSLAERIMNEALGFLALCARESGHGPTELVDLGWHAFIGYMLEYEAFCYALARRVLYHMPVDVKGYTHPAIRGRRSLADTAAAMQRHGPVDEELWHPRGRNDGFCNCDHRPPPPPSGGV